jgi:hypothetical protein
LSIRTLIIHVLLALALLGQSATPALAVPSERISSIYLYAHADPVNNIDPSGHFSLPDVTAAMGTLSKVASMSYRVGRALNTAYTLVDGFNTARQVISFLASPQSLGVEAALQKLAANATDEFKEVLSPAFVEDAFRVLRDNLPRVTADFPRSLANPNLIRILSKPTAKFVVFMPTPPVGPNPHEYVGTPFNIGWRGVKKDVGLYFGKGDWRGRFIGFGVAGGSTPGDDVYQFFRMDYHSAHYQFGNAARPDWADGRFHFHTTTAN